MASMLDRLLPIYEEVLRCPCQPSDNFFDAGGDSLLAQELVETVAARLGIDIEIALLLDYQTPEELAEALSR